MYKARHFRLTGKPGSAGCMDGASRNLDTVPVRPRWPAALERNRPFGVCGHSISG
ncbi:MAG: hypothetical protein LBP76_12090 [Treponema sp.]|nr:hypothetical protein [Treponema sp.]